MADAAPSPPRDPRAVYIAAGLVGLAAAFLFGGYELVRSPSNTLFKAAYGTEGLPYAMAATPLAVFAILWIYGKLLNRLGPMRTLLATTLASAVLLAGCSAAVSAGSKFAAALLYLLREGYIVLLMEQYWSFLNSTLRDQQARKLNGPICGIASAGSIAGAMLVSGLAQPLGTASLVIIGAVVTLPTALLGYLAYRVGGEPAPRQEEVHSDTVGVGLLGREPVLALLLAIILLTQAISGLTDLAFQSALQDRIPSRDEQTAFSGRFFMWLNILAAGMQFILAPLLLRLLPLRWVHRLIPLIHLGTCAYLWHEPGLFSAALAYMAFKVIDYSLFRAAKEVLYIPLSFDARYRAKELIDVFGYRFGKGGMALLVVALQRLRVNVAEPVLGAVAASAALGWFVLSLRIGRTGSEKV